MSVELSSRASSEDMLKRSMSPPSDDKVRKKVVGIGASYIVQAPAGSGKTSLLVNRYINLLSRVNEPEEVLAITFTRKAAREMKFRIMKELGNEHWPNEPEMLSPATRAALERSRRRGWDIHLNPQRLRIQTIDGFAYWLVKRLPYESALSMEYETIDKGDHLYDDAASATIEQALIDSELGEDVADFLRFQENNSLRCLTLLANMLGKREHWIEIVSSVQRELLDADSRKEALKKLGENRKQYIEEIQGHGLLFMTDALTDEISEVCSFAAATLGVEFHDLAELEDLVFVAKTFCTQSGTYRKTVNKSQGFPPGKPFAEWKDLWETMRDALAFADPNCLFEKMQRLPPREAPESHQQALEFFTGTLIRAVLALTDIFSQRRVVDHTEVSNAAMRALQSDNVPTELALALDYKISHILVDEFQDTSRSQFRLFLQLMQEWEANSGNTFFAVGDPMQSIYGFRNAELGLYQSIYRNGITELPQLEISPEQLKVNFRSTPTVIAAVNRVFKEVFGEQDDIATGRVAFAESTPHLDESDGAVSMTLCTDDPDGSEEAHQVALKVKELRKSQNTKIGLLVQTRTHIDRYLDAFRNEEVTWSGVNIESMASVPVVRDLNVLVDCLSDDRNKLAWLAFFRSPLCGLDLFDLERLNEPDSGRAMLNATNISKTGKSLVARARLAFEEYDKDSHRTYRSKLERLWYRLGGNDAYESDESLTNAERFFDWVDEATTDGINLDILRDRMQNEYASQSGTDADVEIITIHQAKGLEFDHVLLPDLNSTPGRSDRELIQWRLQGGKPVVALHIPNDEDPLYDWIKDENRTKELNEKKRLLYVAMTRAKTTLSLFAHFKEEVKRRSNSFFDFVWPTLEEESTEISAAAPPELETSVGTTLSRLDPDYRFEPTALAPVFGEELETTKQPDAEGLAEDYIGVRLEFELSNLVQQELHRQTKLGQLKIPTELEIAAWNNALTNRGLSTPDRNRIVEHARAQMEAIVQDEDALWLLDNSHEESETEIAFTTPDGVGFNNRVIDRSFVDASDTRWLIRYTTSFADEFLSDDDVIDTAKRRFSQYLDSACKQFSETEGRDVRWGIFVTSIPKLVLDHMDANI